MNVNRRGFLRVAGGLAAALTVAPSSLAGIMASKAAPPSRLRMRKFTGTVFVTQELLDDAAFDMTGWLNRQYGESFVMKVIGES